MDPDTPGELVTPGLEVKSKLGVLLLESRDTDGLPVSSVLAAESEMLFDTDPLIGYDCEIGWDEDKTALLVPDQLFVPDTS